MSSRPPDPCLTCRTLHHRDEAAAACAAQLEADVTLLNSHRVHIVGHGVNAGITRETIHALAAAVRAWLRMLGDRQAEPLARITPPPPEFFE